MSQHEEARASAAARHRRLTLEAAAPPDEMRAEKSKRQNRRNVEAAFRFWEREHTAEEKREIAEAFAEAEADAVAFGVVG